MANDAFDNAYADKEALRIVEEQMDAAADHRDELSGPHSFQQPTPLQKGDVCMVIRGRKTPVGVVGRIFWVGDSKWGARFGLTVVTAPHRQTVTAPGETVWIASKNVRPLTPEELLTHGRAIMRVEAEGLTKWACGKARDYIAAGDLRGAGRMMEVLERKLQPLRESGLDITNFLNEVHAAAAMPA